MKSETGGTVPPVSVSGLVVALIIGWSTVAVGCGSSDPGTGAAASPSSELTAGVTAELVSTWLNQTGLAGPDLDTWEARLRSACAAPMWDVSAGTALAGSYVEQDGGDPVDPALVDGAATALWIMAAQACPDGFPPGALEEGPPYGSGS